MHDNRLATASADRAVQAAALGNNPLVLAESQLLAATVLRHIGHRDTAQALVLAAPAQLRDATGLPDPGHQAMYGQLLAVAAYTARSATPTPTPGPGSASTANSATTAPPATTPATATRDTSPPPNDAAAGGAAAHRSVSTASNRSSMAQPTRPSSRWSVCRGRVPLLVCTDPACAA
jgi:hypothetical protein